MNLHEKVTDKDYFVKCLKEVIKVGHKDSIILCIGTDKVSGDSFAPFVGTFLKDYGFTNVIGCLEDSVNYSNLLDVIKTLPKNKKVIAIDASMGRMKDIGKLLVSKGCIEAAKSVQNNNIKVGDYKIEGIVGIGGFGVNLSRTLLMTTSLHLVVSMAKVCAEGLSDFYGVKKKKYILL